MKVQEEIEILTKDLDDSNITSILKHYKEADVICKALEEYKEQLKTKIRIFLKERKWDSYKDGNTDISVKISIQTREVIDKEQLKIMLTDAQYAQVNRFTKFEKLTIITPENREKLKKIIRKDYYKGKK